MNDYYVSSEFTEKNQWMIILIEYIISTFVKIKLYKYSVSAFYLHRKLAQSL